MPPQLPIIVIADDLSGAAELAGIAYHHGLSAEVHHVFSNENDAQLLPRFPDASKLTADVIAIDTDSRNLPSATAIARLHAVAQHFLALKPAWVFKKVDSVLRGNVRAEIEATLDATGHRQAVLIPANPSRGRTIQDGRYFIDGIPLHETYFAADPHFPRRSSELSWLLGTALAGPPRMATPDVTSAVDLAQLAANCGPDTLPAGAADFFQELLSQRASRREASVQNFERPVITLPALLVCGSRAAWPDRVKACDLAGVPGHVLHGLPEPLGGFRLLNWCSKPSTGRNRSFVVGLIGLGDEAHSNSERALRALAAWVSVAIKSLAIKTILVEGGATAAAVAQEMNWSQFTVVTNSTGGVGVLQPIVLGAPRLLIKPGSYPWPTEIWDAFCRLVAD